MDGGLWFAFSLHFSAMTVPAIIKRIAKPIAMQAIIIVWRSAIIDKHDQICYVDM